MTMPVGRITNPQGFINTSGNAVIKDNHVTEYSDFCFAIPFGDYIIGIKHNQNAFDAFNSPKLYLLKNGSNHSSILLGGPNKSFFNDYFNKWMHIYDEDTKLYGLLSSDKKTIKKGGSRRMKIKLYQQEIVVAIGCSLNSVF